jgi:hypothetical protein
MSYKITVTNSAIGSVTTNVTGTVPNVTIRNGVVTVAGNVVAKDLTGIVEIKWDGPAALIRTDASVTCESVTGDVHAMGNVTANNVHGDVSAGGNIKCNNVEGTATAGGNIKVQR